MGKNSSFLCHIKTNPLCKHHVTDPTALARSLQLAAATCSASYHYNTTMESLIPRAQRHLPATDAPAANAPPPLAMQDVPTAWAAGLATSDVLHRAKICLRTPPAQLEAQYVQALAPGVHLLAANMECALGDEGADYITAARFAILARPPGSSKLEKSTVRERIRRFTIGQGEHVFRERCQEFAAS